MKKAFSVTLIFLVMITLSSCDPLVKLGLKKLTITFDANGGRITEKYLQDSNDSDSESDSVDDEGGESASSEGENGSAGVTTLSKKYKAGKVLPKDVVARDYYEFIGWYTKPDGGDEVKEVPEEDMTLYAHWEVAVKDRSVEISNVRTKSAKNRIRIARYKSQNKVKVTFTISKYLGQEFAFVDKAGGVISRFDVHGDTTSGKDIGSAESEYTAEPFDVTTYLPDDRWMDRKTSTYYIKSLAGDLVDESEAAEIKITLAGESEYFNRPIEGSTCWYGGAGETPEDRTGVIIATSDDYVYTISRKAAKAKQIGSRKIYKWEKSNVMINLADVRTDIVYDIYNAYDSRFFPITGKAMYSDNGASGLKRYETIDKASAMHKNAKTGKTTFMVPVQWYFAETVAIAQSKARKEGKTLYIVDTFRPMASVDPVAKAVDDSSLLAYGGRSAHTFGFAVDAGWQDVDDNDEPTGEPYVKNLQALNKKLAVSGPNGNSSEPWWEGVTKLKQEWWHYGDGVLRSGYSDQAKRVAALYVNQNECPSVKRSALNN